MAELGVCLVGFLQATQYLIYDGFPKFHWTTWQLFPIPLAILLYGVLTGLDLNLGVGHTTVHLIAENF